MEKYVNVIGAGLAGCEASYQLAKRHIKVKLYEMKKEKKSPAHKSDLFSELVCSNSFRSDDIHNAVGLLKEELRMLDSLILRAADETKVLAGSSLAVDRDLFSKYITDEIRNNPYIEVIDKEVTEIMDGYVILATGPLTSDLLSEKLADFLGTDYLYFFDAAAPIITASSIDYNKVFLKSRYDKGEPAYLNCPFTKEEFEAWYKELISADVVTPKDFEFKVFEGCMPFEEMAKRGEKTLLFGPMKPMGLTFNGVKPYAVCQLRSENQERTLFNIVGFQTHLTFSAQKKIIQMIPGLEKANIVRYGVMHRNTFINAPLTINEYYQTRKREDLFIAGQLSGVEGYVESTASGLVAGINMAKLFNGEPLIKFPVESAIGIHAHYISHAESETFQPMNINFGIFTPLNFDVKKTNRKEKYVERALDAIKKIQEVI